LTDDTDLFCNVNTIYYNYQRIIKLCTVRAMAFLSLRLAWMSWINSSGTKQKHFNYINNILKNIKIIKNLDNIKLLVRYNLT